MFSTETDRSKLTQTDLKRAKEAQAIRQLALAVAVLHAWGVSTGCGLPKEDRERMTNELQSKLNGMSRKDTIQYLRNEEKRFADFLSTYGNPGAHETQLSLQTRRLELISSVIKELPEEINGGLVVVAVDAYLGISDFGLDGMSLTQKHSGISGG